MLKRSWWTMIYLEMTTPVMLPLLDALVAHYFSCGMM
jgi:hypothetical protein